MLNTVMEQEFEEHACDATDRGDFRLTCDRCQKEQLVTVSVIVRKSGLGDGANVIIPESSVPCYISCIHLYGRGMAVACTRGVYTGGQPPRDRDDLELPNAWVGDLSEPWSGVGFVITAVDCCSQKEIEPLGVPDLVLYRGTPFEKDDLTDWVVKCEGREFHVHRSILAKHSPVLRSMMEVDMNERKTGLLDLGQGGVDLLEKFLRALYGQTELINEELSWEDLQDLHGMFRMYDLPRLSERCCRICSQQVDRRLESLALANYQLRRPLTTWFDLLATAAELGLTIEFERCAEVLAWSQEELQTSEEWRKVRREKPALAMRILDSFAARAASFPPDRD